MRMDARVELKSNGTPGPDPWDESWGLQLPLDHIICHDIDGTAHTVREYVWPWSAYTSHQQRLLLHFYYWKQTAGKVSKGGLMVSPEREARIRELQFLMTRPLYYGEENSARRLDAKLRTLHHLARFAETRSCTVRDVLTQPSLLDACSARMPDSYVTTWMGWLTFLGKLDPDTQLGFTLATPKRWGDLDRRAKALRDNHRQYAPLPTRIYAGLINNLSAELDDIEAHAPRLLACLREALVEHAKAKAVQTTNDIRIGPALIKKHALADYFERRQLDLVRPLLGLIPAVTEVFQVCKLQIHVFSGMRHKEAGTLPYHCMDRKIGKHGRKHCLIAGTTTKFNKGRRLRTHWVTTDNEGFRAIRLAQRFADVIYEGLGITPSKVDDAKDAFPLFPSSYCLPWGASDYLPGAAMPTAKLSLSSAKDSFLARLCPVIEEEDIAELEEIDPFRVWRAEPDFAIGQLWPLTTHQLRRSLALYANASGLVRSASLRRQLQQLTLEMAHYYGRGSTFCKNFIEDDPEEYKKHIALDWQDGEEEALVLAFTRDVINSTEPMFGGAGNFYTRQKERGEVMAREDVAKEVKAGRLAWQPGPLGGCTNTDGCINRKGLALIDIACASDECKYLVGKHSKVQKVLLLKRAAAAHITPGSIEAAMEKEELEALERVELKWRPQNGPVAGSIGAAHG